MGHVIQGGAPLGLAVTHSIGRRKDVSKLVSVLVFVSLLMALLPFGIVQTQEPDACLG